MQRRQTIFLAAGLIFLLHSLAFLLFNVLRYEIGISLPWDPYAAVTDYTQPSLWPDLFNISILLGPGFAFGLFLWPMIDVQLNWRQDQFVTITINKGSRAGLLLMAACLVIFGLFMVYLVAENLPCLLGQQLRC